MQYKCEVCHDTGSKEKDMGGHLTCISCSAAQDRVMLESFIESLPAMGEQEQAWRIHQRALAMAPKQEAPTQEPVAWMHDQPGRVDCIHREVKDLWLKVGQPNGFYREKVPCKVEHYTIPLYAAPAVANGALPELPEEAAGSCEVITGHETIRGMQAEIVEYHPAYSADQMRAYGQACAAAGPDAALIEVIKEALDCFLLDHSDDHPTAKRWRAALSGAKGN